MPTAVLSVPARYIHTPASVLNLTDLEATLELAQAGELCGSPR